MAHCFTIHGAGRRIGIISNLITASSLNGLTHLPRWGGCIYASLNWVIFGSGNGLSPVQRQAISWTNTGLLSIELVGASFSGIWILSFSFKKMQLKRLSAKMAAILSRGRWVKKKRWPNFLPHICIARLQWVKILKNVFMLTYTVVFFLFQKSNEIETFTKPPTCVLHLHMHR